MCQQSRKLPHIAYILMYCTFHTVIRYGFPMSCRADDAATTATTATTATVVVHIHIIWKKIDCDKKIIIMRIERKANTKTTAIPNTLFPANAMNTNHYKRRAYLGIFVVVEIKWRISSHKTHYRRGYFENDIFLVLSLWQSLDTYIWGMLTQMASWCRRRLLFENIFYFTVLVCGIKLYPFDYNYAATVFPAFFLLLCCVE